MTKLVEDTQNFQTDNFTVVTRKRSNNTVARRRSDSTIVTRERSKSKITRKSSCNTPLNPNINTFYPQDFSNNYAFILAKKGEGFIYFGSRRAGRLPHIFQDIKKNKYNSIYRHSAFYPEAFNQEWSIEVNAAFWMGGMDKKRPFFINTLLTPYLSMRKQDKKIKGTEIELFWLVENGYTFYEVIRGENYNLLALPASKQAVALTSVEHITAELILGALKKIERDIAANSYTNLPEGIRADINLILNAENKVETSMPLEVEQLKESPQILAETSLLATEAKLLVTKDNTEPSSEQQTVALPNVEPALFPDSKFNHRFFSPCKTLGILSVAAITGMAVTTVMTYI